jgi:hypothetical protein
MIQLNCLRKELVEVSDTESSSIVGGIFKPNSIIDRFPHPFPIPFPCPFPSPVNGPFPFPSPTFPHPFPIAF